MISDSEILEKVRRFADEEARLADKSAHEWSELGPNDQAAYRAGMWFAYRQIQCLLPPKE